MEKSDIAESPAVPISLYQHCQSINYKEQSASCVDNSSVILRASHQLQPIERYH